MAVFKVVVKKQVPAYAEVEVKANSLEEACMKVQEDIREHESDSEAAAAEFTADWSEAYGLTLADVTLPDGRNFSSKP